MIPGKSGEPFDGAKVPVERESECFSIENTSPRGAKREISGIVVRFNAAGRRGVYGFAR
jgi:hypothetical protein